MKSWLKKKDELIDDPDAGYKKYLAQYGVSNPDDPRHNYDYRGAYNAGISPTKWSDLPDEDKQEDLQQIKEGKRQAFDTEKAYMWPDEFKTKGHEVPPKSFQEELLSEIPPEQLIAKVPQPKSVPMAPQNSPMGTYQRNFEKRRIGWAKDPTLSLIPPPLPEEGTREPLLKLTEKVQPRADELAKKGKLGQAAAGAIEGAAGVAEGFTSPEAIGTLGEAAVVPAVGLSFIPSMAKGVWQGGKEAYQGFKEGDYRKAAKGAVGAVASAVMLKKLGQHGMKTVEPAMKGEPTPLPVPALTVEQKKGFLKPVEPQGDPIIETESRLAQKAGLTDAELTKFVTDNVKDGVRYRKIADDVNNGRMTEEDGVTALKQVAKPPTPTLTQPQTIQPGPITEAEIPAKKGFLRSRQIDDIDRQSLTALRTDIEKAEAGYRGATETETGAVGFGSPSTFPVKDTGLGKAEQLQIIDGMLSGKKLTGRQQAVADKFTEHIRKAEGEAGAFAKDWHRYRDQMKLPDEQAPEARIFNKGDKIQTPHDIYEVTKVDDFGVTFKGGKEFTVGPDEKVPAVKFLGQGGGEGAALPPELPPPQTPKGWTRLKFTKTVETSPRTTAEIAEGMKDQKAPTITNKETINTALEAIKQDELGSAKRVYDKDVHDADTTALGIELGNKWMQDATRLEKAGNIVEADKAAQRAIDILTHVSRKARTHGQNIQILSAWNRFDPEGIIRTVTGMRRKVIGEEKIKNTAIRLRNKAGRPLDPIDAYIKSAEDMLGVSLKPTEAKRLFNLAEIAKNALAAELRAGLPPNVTKPALDTYIKSAEEMLGTKIKGKTPQQKQVNLAEIARKELERYVNSLRPTNFMDKALEYRSAALLTGPRTHIVNITSQLGTQIYRPIISTASALVDFTQTGGGLLKPRQRFFGEAVADTYGKIATFPQAARNGLQAAIDSWKGQPGGKEIETQRAPANKGPIGKVMRAPFHMLSAADAMQMTMNQGGQLFQLAYRQAAMEGKKGKALLSRVNELVKNPSEEMLQNAEIVAKQDMFKEPLGEAGKAIGRARESRNVGGYAFKFIMPFYQTPTNVPRYFLRQTPFSVTNWKDVVKGGGERADAIARMALGGTIAALLTMLAGKETEDGRPYITGALPSNKGEADLWRRMSVQPYSVKIGDNYYSYQRLQPFGMFFALAAATQRAWGERNEKEFSRLAGQVAGEVSKSLIDMPFLTGMNDFLNALFEPDRYGANYVAQQLSSFIPTLSGNVAMGMDPTFRKARSFKDTLLKKIPILNEAVPPARNLWGEPAKQEGSIWNRLFSPAPRTFLKPVDPVDAELKKLEYFPSPPDDKVRGVKLDADIYNWLAEQSGKMLKATFNDVINGEDYKDTDLTDADRKDMFETAYKDVFNVTVDPYNDVTLSRGEDRFGFNTEALGAQIDRDAQKNRDNPDKYIHILLKSRAITDSDSEENDYLIKKVAAGLNVPGETIDKQIRKFYKYEKPEAKGPLSSLDEVKKKYATDIADAAVTYGISAHDLAKQIWHESKGDPKALSKAGAIGLMQVMPKTAKALGMSLKTPRDQIMAGAKYQADMLRLTKGNKMLAYAAYNAGPGNMRSGQWKNFKETKDYVAKMTE